MLVSLRGSRIFSWKMISSFYEGVSSLAEAIWDSWSTTLFSSLEMSMKVISLNYLDNFCAFLPHCGDTDDMLLNFSFI